MSDEKNNTSDDKQPPDTDAASSAEDLAGVDAPVGEEAAAEDSPTRPKGSPLADRPAPAPAAAAKPTKKGSSAVGWLALLLVLALGGGAAWIVQQGLQREAGLEGRIAELENSAGGGADELAAVQRQWRRQLDKELEEPRAVMAAQQQGLEDLREAQESMRRDILGQAEKLASFSATDHENWLRAEIQYLLRLANQRVIMAHDVESAQALLSSADSILRELNDPSLHEVRAAIAAELAALRAVPRIDVEGIYLRLSALIEQSGQLVIFQMPEMEDQPEAEPADNWQVRLERGYEEAARKLSDYIVIRRRDVPMQALMDPQWEGLVRQNLRMLLEQAQVALLSGNQSLYEESLARAQHWVAQFFESDEAAARAMEREINLLSEQTVQVLMPEISRSLKALDKAVQEQLQQGGAE